MKIAADLYYEHIIWIKQLASDFSADYKESCQLLMRFFCVQNKLVFYWPILLLSDLSIHHVPYIPPPPNNILSRRPTSVPVCVFPSPMSVLGVWEVGCIPIASAITPIIYPLSFFFACPPIMPISALVSIPSATLIVMMLSLTSVYVVPFLAKELSLPSEVLTLVSRQGVVNRADVIRSRLPAEVHVQVGTVA